MSTRITQVSTITNVSGETSRLEKSGVVRRTETQYQHVRQPVMVQRPEIEDFNNLVVVHDQVEQYI